VTRVGADQLPSHALVAAALDDLRDDVPQVHRVMLATSDGLPLVTDHQAALSEPHEAAMTAAVLALGSQVGSTVGGGDFIDCVIRSTESIVCVVAVGGGHVLAVSAPAGVNLGLLLRQSRITARRLVGPLPGAVGRQTTGRMR
jgi:predicted regulator of Ras-like GTPase activity (Roadblock/LC7/MglB family)